MAAGLIGLTIAMLAAENSGSNNGIHNYSIPIAMNAVVPSARAARYSMSVTLPFTRVTFSFKAE